MACSALQACSASALFGSTWAGLKRELGGTVEEALAGYWARIRSQPEADQVMTVLEVSYHCTPCQVLA